MPRPFLLVASLAATVAVTVAATPASLAPGLAFTMRTSTRTGTAAPRGGDTTRVQVLGGAIRFDGNDGKSYVVVTPAARRLAIVMPAERQYVELSLSDSAAQGAGAMLQLLASTTVVSDIEVSGTSLGGGGTVAGQATSRHRITMSYAEAPGGDGERRRRVRSVEEFWVAPALRDVPDPLEAFTRAFGGKDGMPAVGGTASELLRRRGEAQRKLFSGLPLKSVATVTTTEADGTTATETTTTEITELRRVDLDPSAFAIPPGFRKVDFNQFANLGARLRGAVGDRAREDSARASDAAKDAATDAARAKTTEAKDRAKCALGRFMKKKDC